MSAMQPEKEPIAGQPPTTHTPPPTTHHPPLTTHLIRLDQVSVQFGPQSVLRDISIGVEQGFGPNATLTFEASEARGFHLPRLRNVNGTIPPLYELEQTSRSDFRGASISLNRRMRRSRRARR